MDGSGWLWIFISSILMALEGTWHVLTHPITCQRSTGDYPFKQTVGKDINAKEPMVLTTQKAWWRDILRSVVLSRSNCLWSNIEGTNVPSGFSRCFNIFAHLDLFENGCPKIHQNPLEHFSDMGHMVQRHPVDSSWFLPLPASFLLWISSTWSSSTPKPSVGLTGRRSRFRGRLAIPDMDWWLQSS